MLDAQFCITSFYETNTLYFHHQTRGVFYCHILSSLPYELQVKLPILLIIWERITPQPRSHPVMSSLSLCLYSSVCPAVSLSSSRFQPLPHDRRGPQQLHPGLFGDTAGLLVLSAIPAAVPWCHRHPPHLGGSAQHQHHQPHQQTGQIRLRGSH